MRFEIGFEIELVINELVYNLQPCEIETKKKRDTHTGQANNLGSIVIIVVVVIISLLQIMVFYNIVINVFLFINSYFFRQ